MSSHSHRRDPWGDDPEERDADAVVAELSAIDEGGERRWHDHPALAPFKAVGLFIARNGHRIAVTIAGFLVILVGLALLVLPGPGWLLIFAGLAILSTEYLWASRLLAMAREKARLAKDKVLEKKRQASKTDGSDVP